MIVSCTDEKTEDQINTSQALSNILHVCIILYISSYISKSRITLRRSSDLLFTCLSTLCKSDLNDVGAIDPKSFYEVLVMSPCDNDVISRYKDRKNPRNLLRQRG